MACTANRHFETILTATPTGYLVMINLHEDSEVVCGCTGYEGDDYESAMTSSLWEFVKSFPEAFNGTEYEGINIDDITEPILHCMFGFV